MTNGYPYNLVQTLGELLIAILLNGYLFGVICQQLYSYWISRFEDPVYMKVFIFTQFTIIVVQTVLFWNLAWNVFIVGSDLLSSTKSATWQALVASSCQLVLIIMANGFLVSRIYSLTGSRLQSGLVLAFSAIAFVIGIVTFYTTYYLRTPTANSTPVALAAAAVWQVSQAIAECLIMFFLARALLTSRSGLKKSDSIVNHLVRNVVQIGLFATIWAIAGLATYFLLPRRTIFTIFNATSGPIYTHMIFDGLLSRSRLRSRLAERSELEIGLPSQSVFDTSQTRTLEGKRSSGVAQVHGTVSLVTMADFRTGTQHTSDPSGSGKDANSELEGEAASKPEAGYDLSV